MARHENASPGDGSRRQSGQISRQMIFAAGFAAATIIAIGFAWIGRDSQPVADAIGPAATVGELMIIPPAERSMVPQVQMAVAEFAGGGVFDLEAARGEIVVFYFMAAWCKTCEPEAQALARIHDKFSGQGVKVVIVDIDLTETDLELQGFSDRIGPNANLWVFAGESDIVMYGRPRCCKGKTDLNWR